MVCMRQIPKATKPQYNPAVRKFLIIILLAWMPTQLTWAAVSAYCEHEQALSSQSAHPGHHEHEHTAPADSSLPADTGTAHPDCSVCQAATTLPGTEALVRMVLTADALPHFVLTPFPVPPSGAPDRPNWRAA
jgi:ABC-type nickel/cobalt efflux system permease component RcnA